MKWLSLSLFEPFISNTEIIALTLWEDRCERLHRTALKLKHFPAQLPIKPGPFNKQRVSQKFLSLVEGGGSLLCYNGAQNADMQ